jgi:hypothetical protein
MIPRLTIGVVLLALAPTGAERLGDNTLTEQERRDGWVLIFDGKTTRDWMTPKGKPLPGSHVQEGSLNPHPCDYMLVYEKPLGDFVLALDFKISPKCNSGVFVRTSPLTPRPGKDVGFNGLEIAIDDTRMADFHDTGAIYDLVKPKANAMKPRRVESPPGHLRPQPDRGRGERSARGPHGPRRVDRAESAARWLGAQVRHCLQGSSTTGLHRHPGSRERLLVSQYQAPDPRNVANGDSQGPSLRARLEKSPPRM